MRKGIVIVDIPDNCRDCPLRNLADYCINEKNVEKYRHNKNKPDWCPIRPMPQKANHKGDNKDLISRKALMEGRVENDQVRTAALCAPAAFDKAKVVKELTEVADLSVEDGLWHIELQEAIEIIEKAGIDTEN